MRKSFGNTWWGKQWLNALTHIDYSNRLPRGRTYARNGSVHDITIKNNQIIAKVQGSFPNPYQVKVTIPAFSAKEQALITDIVTDNPVYLSQLLNKKLPTDLYDTFTQAGIQIFPKTWKDIKGVCSCPDSAVPCKHLAAVLYLIANEIDKNPFIVFDLHDFDLFKALEKANFVVEGQSKTPIPQATELWQPYGKNEAVFTWKKKVFEQLDFTKIPDCSEQILILYGENPVFYPEGNFKKLLAGTYKSVAKSVHKLNSTLEPDNQLSLVKNIEIILNEELEVKTINIRASEDPPLKEFKDFDDFVNWLAPIPLRDIQHYANELAGSILTYQLAKRLVQKWAYIPQFLEVNANRFKIRWLAATLNEGVQNICEQTAELVPPHIVFFHRGKEIFELPPKEHFNTLLSLFINHLVHNYHGTPIRYLSNATLSLFFAGKTERFLDFERQEYPEAIQLWLNKFYIREKTFAPVLQVEELEDSDRTVFRVSAAIDDRNHPMDAPVNIELVFNQDKYNYLRLPIIRDMSMLAEHFPQLNTYLANKGKTPLIFDSKTFVHILFNILPVVKLFGIQILLPKALRKVIRPKVSIALSGEDTNGAVATTSLVNLDNMLTFDWQIAMGEESIEPADFLRLVAKYSGIVKLNDQFVYFDEKEIKSLIEKMATPPKLSSNDLLKVALTEEYNGSKIKLDQKAQDLLKQLLDTQSIPQPKGLKATLRPYQNRGFDWLYKNAQLGFGSIIADDMGLGKTLQVITTLLKMKEEGAFQKNKALVIVPTTLLTNWGKEIEKFAPELKVHIYHGTNRKLEALKEADALITTYGIIRSEEKTLAKMKWTTVIIDEAQAIKNPGTAQTKAVKKMKAPIKIAMSGTPVENRMSEYWSIFDFTNKGYLNSLKNFTKEFAKPIEAERDQKKLEYFKKLTAPFILRRLKSDRSIIKDLPEKIEQDHFCTLTPEQTALYENVVKTTMETIEVAEGIARKGLVLKLITALKQVCNHPYQFLKKGLVLPNRSGKTQLLFQLLDDILENGEKMLIFTQYQTMGDYLCHMLKEDYGIEASFLHGGVSRNKRDEMVDDFQTNRDAKILILSLKAGGTGLNLTAANHVIHYDLWWNPAVEAQATDRAYRIGQQKNVMVHRFISQGTFEEKINQMLQQKKELANLTVATGETWIGNYGDEELRDLVSLE